MATGNWQLATGNFLWLFFRGNMSAILQSHRAIMEGRRPDHAWPVKDMARVLDIHPNKVSRWWYDNRQRLQDLARAMPRETAEELIRIMAAAGGAADREQT